MYRRDLRDTSLDELLADMAAVDSVVQAVPAPTGERIAYAKTREGQIDLWLLDGRDDVRLTSTGILAMRYGRGDQQWFDWHPDGDRIAFLDAEATISVVDIETGRVDRLTQYDDPDLALSWSPDGDELALVTDHFSRGSLAVIQSDGTRLEALADDQYLYAHPWWGESGIVAVRAHHRDLFDFEAHLVRVSSEGVEVLFEESGVRARSPRPQPGGDAIAFVHDATGYDAIYLTDGSSTDRLYGREGAEIADPAWNATGDRLAATVTEDAAVNVLELTLDGEVTEHTAGRVHYTAPRWIDEHIIAVGDDPVTPPAVCEVTAGEGIETQRLTPTTIPGFGHLIPMPETITYDSAGLEIQAVVYPPDEDAAPDSVPLLVKAHGGPTSLDRLRFDFRAGYFAALGYAVVLPNYRGSDGYGRAFRNENDEDWGGGDLQDVINSADAAADAYEAIDGDRVGIYGGSGGGLMTVNALGNSDRFRAGAAFYGVYDYETFMDDTDDIGWQLMKRELGYLATDIENYRDASPIRFVEEIDAPLLVLHGEDDRRVPISQSEQLVDALEAHGKRYEFQRYDGEPHGFGDREHVVDAYTRVADLFAKYLLIDPDDGSSRPHPPVEG